MPESFSNGYAVLVGVGADLPTTIEDAKAVSNVLTDSSRCAYLNDHVRLLTTETARRNGIISALDWLATSAGQDSTAIVYFSGHGIEKPDFYLVPYGFQWEELATTAISGTEFTNHLREIKCQKLLVLLDCYYAGGQADAKGVEKSPIPKEFYDELARSSGRVIIASSRKNETSFSGNPYSQFTMALLEGLAGSGAFEQDGFARVLDIAMYVGRVIPTRTGEKQHPIIKVNNLKDNFAVAWYAGGNRIPKNLPWQESIPAISNITTDTEQIASWRRSLANKREALLLIEERMSEYIEYTTIPLQLIKNRQLTEAIIKELETKLGER